MKSLPEDQEKRRRRFGIVHSRPCRIILASGRTVSVDRFEMMRTYLGQIDGIPTKGDIDQRIAKARDYVVRKWGGPKCVLIPPKVRDPESDSPVLPSLTMMAQLSSMEPRNDSEDGSWLNVIWYAEVDDNYSMMDLIETAIADLNWEKEADAYLI